MTRVEGVDVPIKKFTFGHLKKQIWPNNNEANKLRTIFPVGYIFPPNHIHIVIQPPPPATGFSHQGVPQVTLIEDAIKKILEGIHKKMDVDNVGNNKPKPMTLKQRDLKQAIDVIDRNFCNSLDKQEPIKKETPMAKTNYRILLCGGAPGIGKTRYGVELFNCLDKKWKISKGQKPYMLYMLLDFTNGYALDEYEIQKDIKIASEIILGLRVKWGEKLFKQLMYTFGNHMAGEIPEVFVQTLLLGTALQDVIRAIEPTMYSIESFDLLLLFLESRLEIMREFATNHDVSDCVWARFYKG
ncbi:hypothetical protein GLOIN_2v1729495 [Rhizophagus irregularis DAOM 181602=DAOM 197198]|nr:hypothetical protein GLOIN_2v1729495 [Rhizophagus irregularis DAOM 181602=DAOM 197198]